MIRQKVSQGRSSASFGSNGFIEGVWERFTIKKRWEKMLVEDATKEVQLETSSSWQNESPNNEELELLRLRNDPRLAPSCVERLRQEKNGRLGGVVE